MSDSTERSSNPLGAITKKPASYVGNLDDLLGQVADPPPGGEVRSKSSKQEMKIVEAQSRINLLIPAPLHRQFKAATAVRGVTMTSVLEACIRDYIAGS